MNQTDQFNVKCGDLTPDFGPLTPDFGPYFLKSYK